MNFTLYMPIRLESDNAIGFIFIIGNSFVISTGVRPYFLAKSSFIFKSNYPNLPIVKMPR